MIAAPHYAYTVTPSATAAARFGGALVVGGSRDMRVARWTGPLALVVPAGPRLVPSPLDAVVVNALEPCADGVAVATDRPAGLVLRDGDLRRRTVLAADGVVGSLAADDAGGLLVGGSFTHLGGVTAAGLARVDCATGAVVGLATPGGAAVWTVAAAGGLAFTLDRTAGRVRAYARGEAGFLEQPTGLPAAGVTGLAADGDGGVVVAVDRGAASDLVRLVPGGGAPVTIGAGPSTGSALFEAAGGVLVAGGGDPGGYDGRACVVRVPSRRSTCVGVDGRVLGTRVDGGRTLVVGPLARVAGHVGEEGVAIDASGFVSGVPALRHLLGVPRAVLPWRDGYLVGGQLSATGQVDRGPLLRLRTPTSEPERLRTSVVDVRALARCGRALWVGGRTRDGRPAVDVLGAGPALRRQVRALRLPGEAIDEIACSRDAVALAGTFAERPPLQWDGVVVLDRRTGRIDRRWRRVHVQGVSVTAVGDAFALATYENRPDGRTAAGSILELRRARPPRRVAHRESAHLRAVRYSRGEIVWGGSGSGFRDLTIAGAAPVVRGRIGRPRPLAVPLAPAFGVEAIEPVPGGLVVAGAEILLRSCHGRWLRATTPGVEQLRLSGIGVARGWPAVAVGAFSDPTATTDVGLVDLDLPSCPGA